MRIKEHNATVPERIIKIIKESGMKQCVVAERAGLTAQELTDMIKGRRIIKINELIALSTALGVEVNDLVKKVG